MSAGDLLGLIFQLASVFTILSVIVLSLIWIERKFLGRLQRRVGPTRTGPFGLLQPVADALKLILKEDLAPTMADRALFWIAPLAVLVPSFAIWVTIPATHSLVVRNLDMGLFYVIALSVLSIVGMVLAGWASANKYALLGGLRAAGQLLSYEIPLIFTALAVVILTGSLSLVEIVESQSQRPYALIQPLGMVIFLLAGLAEIGRTPFDIHFAESEIMGGPFIEYSGAHFAVFFLAEYINTFAIAALVALLYLGGWHGPLLPPLVWFLMKTYAVVLVIFWFRGTFPRLRIDQLMAFAWKVLLPLSFVNLVLTSFFRFYEWPGLMLGALSVLIISTSFGLVQRHMRSSKMPLSPNQLTHLEVHK